MQFVIDEIIYHNDKTNPQIDISWSIITTNNVKIHYRTESFNWENYPEILDCDTIKKMKPSLNNSSENNLFLSHSTHSKRLINLIGNQLEITHSGMVTTEGKYKKIKLAKQKQTMKSHEMSADELRVLYPLSYVIYPNNRLGDGTPCRVPLYLVCTKGLIMAEPSPSMYKTFKPPRSLSDHSVKSLKTSTFFQRQLIFINQLLDSSEECKYQPSLLIKEKPHSMQKEFEEPKHNKSSRSIWGATLFFHEQGSEELDQDFDTMQVSIL